MDSRPRALQLVGSLAAVTLLFSLVSAQTCIKRDRDALLKFKAGLNDSDDQLMSWNTTSNCCKDFVGVTCNSKGEVIKLNFEAFFPEECDEDCPFIRNKKPGSDLIGSTLSKLLALQTLNLTGISIDGPFPTGLSALKNLSFLSLNALSLTGPIPADLWKITTLKYLAFNGPKGGFTSGVCKLTKLEVLDFTETTFSFGGNGAGIGGSIPSCIGDLQQLRQLLVEYNNFTGPIPDSIRRLQKLQQLKLTGNFLTGQIPAFLGELKALEVLYLQGNEFTGPIPSSLGNLSSLKDLRIGGTAFLSDGAFLDLKFTNIDGNIPASLGNLQNLQTLYIKGTKITGSIPASLGNVKTLTDLQLDFNSLTGPLPASLTGTNLTTFNFNDNQISGGIPPAYGKFRNLQRFVGTRNKLTGPLPKELSNWRFQDAGLLDLSDNMLTGTIPEDLGMTIRFGDFNLSYNKLTGSLKASSWYEVTRIYLNNNQLTGLQTASIPDDGTTALNLQIFDIHSNNIPGPIPQWPFQFYSASAIDLSDNQFTSLPSISSDRISVNYINVSYNKISGKIPDGFSKCNTLDMSHNFLSGSIPKSFATNNLNILDLSWNMLTGQIPAGIFDGTFFNTLVVSHNKLTGPIPERSDSNTFLRNIDVTENILTGSIPVSILNSSFSAVLKAGNNRLTGSIPDFTAGNCFSLESLILENNMLTGPVLPPGADFVDCSRVKHFDVSGNSLTGEVPSELSKFTSLQVLDLSHNNLTGKVKDIFSSMRDLLVLDLSSNKLSGSVPWKKLVSGFSALKVAGTSPVKFVTSVYGLYNLSIYYADLSPGSFIRADFIAFSSTTALNFSNNALSGTVDPAIGQLKGLHAFDVSRNKFSGSVPDTLADITDLDFFDVSFNNFSGPISPKLRNFPAYYFEGNPNLCGAPLPKRCQK